MKSRRLFRFSPVSLLPALALSLLLIPPAPAGAQDNEPSETASSELPLLDAGDTDALIKKEGQKVIVVGKCERTGKSRGGTNFVNFIDSEFVLVTFKSDLGPFEEGEPADIYQGKYLRVTGVIDIYKEKPQIKLTDPAQVEAADEAFAAPDPEADRKAAAAEAAAAEKEKAAMTAARNGNGKTETPANAEAEAAADNKPRPPVDPRKYFKKPATAE